MPQKILNDIFGYAKFRRGQIEVIEALVDSIHTLAVMPTGSGKSICFQIPALIKGGLTIVVSPLVALMEDQVCALKLLGVGAETINSSREREVNITSWNRVVEGKVRLLYLSPERLMTERMIAALLVLPVNLIVLDEAHLLSRWGPSFRTDYEELIRLRDIFPAVTIAALTATADKSTQDDIVNKLFGGEGRVLVSGFDRPNIYLGVATRTDAKQQLLDAVKDGEGLRAQDGSRAMGCQRERQGLQQSHDRYSQALVFDVSQVEVCQSLTDALLIRKNKAGICQNWEKNLVGLRE